MRNRKGFTLLELVIALGIIVTILVVVITVIINVIRINRYNLDRYIAHGLAQEGIESVRFIRDTNWLSNYDFDTGQGFLWGADFSGLEIDESAMYEIVHKDVVNTDNGLEYDIMPLSINSGIDSENTGDLYINNFGNGISYMGGDSTNGKRSKFNRVIEIKKIDDKVLRVYSKVTWPKSGLVGERDGELVLVTDLTEWKTGPFSFE